MADLKDCEGSYQKGEKLFADEHERWQILSNKLLREGYPLNRLEAFKDYYRRENAYISQRKKEISKVERIANWLLKNCWQRTRKKRKYIEIGCNNTEREKGLFTQRPIN